MIVCLDNFVTRYNKNISSEKNENPKYEHDRSQ